MRSFVKWLLILLLALALGMAWLQHRTQTELRTLVTALRPQALLRYERVLAWPPGTWRLQQVTLEPVGAWRERLGMAVGERLQADTAQLHPPARGLNAWRFQADGLRWRLPDGLAGTSALAEAGYQTVRGHLDGVLVWQPVNRAVQLSLTARLDQAGVLDLELRGLAGPDFPAPVTRGTTLHSAQLRWRDAGLLPALKQTLALQAQLPPRRWEQQQLQALAQQAEQAGWRWSPNDQQALRTILRAPVGFTLTLNPTAPVRLDDLPLYAPDDRWALLGLTLAPGVPTP